MSKFKKTSIFKNPFFWFISLSFISSLLIFFVTPYYFEPMTDFTLRLLISLTLFFGTMFLILLFALFVNDEVRKKWRAQRERFRRQKKYSDAIEKKIRELSTQFDEAMNIVKSSSIYKEKQSAGYELPWYLMVGMETEGKTSLLESSGLDFPLNIDYKNRTVTEEGATQSFQWYFAEHAVFVDMPGIYISDSRSEEDTALWDSFLRMFIKKRWARPINGIILTISVDTLVHKTPQELEQYAKDLRDRFDEVSEVLKSNIPIYLLVTKTDKIEGFSEYFASISEEERSEVLGTTFDEQEESIDTSIVQPELEALLKRLNTSILDKMHREWDYSSRCKTLLFCSEFSTLFVKLNTFVDICFARTRYKKPLMLRGIYFTSVLSKNSALATEDFGDGSLANMQYKGGMFIKKLLSNVIFPESDMVKMDSSYKKGQQYKYITALILSVGIVATATIYWLNDFNTRLDTLENTKKEIVEYVRERDNLSDNLDFKQTLISLNTIHNLKNASTKDISDNVWQIAYYKVANRNESVDKLYKEALRTILLPRIAMFIERQILSNIGDYDLTWSSTKAYAMLSNEEKRDNEFLSQWLAVAWANLYPNQIEVQKDLKEHLKNLFAYGFEPYKLREDILVKARKQLLEFGHEALVYKKLKDVAKKKNLKDFRFSIDLGSYSSAFKRSTYTIPGFYTKKGFENVIIADGKELIKTLVSNNWIVGYPTDLSDVELDEMYAKVQNYYFIDYKKHWINALNSLEVPTYKSDSEINNQLTVLTSGTSPIITVLKVLKINTLLYTPAEELQMKARSTLKDNELATLASQNAIEEAKKLTDNTSIKNIREYFSMYNNLLDDDNQPTEALASAMQKLNTVYQEITSVYASVTPDKDSYNIVIDRVSGQHKSIIMRSSKLPRPIDKWFKNILKDSWKSLLKRSKRYVNAQYKLEVLDYYQNKIAERYPLNRYNSNSNIALQDFEEFFKKNGILDTFYQSYLSVFVAINTIQRSYKYRVIDGQSIYISKKFINAMFQAQAIRDTLFTSKEDVLGTSIDIKPHALGLKLSRMEFHYDNTYIGYEHGPIRTKTIIWPAQNLSGSVQFSLFDLQNNRVINDAEEGEWALFKLIDRFNIKSQTLPRGVGSIVAEYKRRGFYGSFGLTGNAIRVFSDDNPLESFQLGNRL